MIEDVEDEALIIIGDFNGHIGILGEQNLDKNGQVILEWMNNYSLILLNSDDECRGTYTWSRGSQKSVIDYMLVNTKMYSHFQNMEVDEKQEKIDVTDHNLLSAEFLIIDKVPNFNRHANWEKIEYYKTDANSLDTYVAKLEESIEAQEISTIEQLNELIGKSTDETSKATYKRKVIEGECKITEPVWMNEQTRQGIKERRRLNRKRRNTAGKEEKQMLEKLYRTQKHKVQSLIKQEM